MDSPQLVLLLLLVLVAAVAVVLVLRRSSSKRDEQRVEAAGIRGEAEGMAATMAGQSTFARQAEERAEVARFEAEERAREAARLEAEAAEQRATAEATRREYEATMRRADDIDPDVKESTFAPVPAATTPDAGAAAAGAVGGSTRAARDEDEAGPESRRIASADEFRDEVPADRAGAGPTADTSDDLSRDTESPRGEWGGPPADSVTDEPAADHEAAAGTEQRAADEAFDLAVVPDPEAHASTEPLLAADAATDADTERAADEATADDHVAGAPDPVETRSEERFDATPPRDWAADEGELLEETHDRGQRLEQERHELEEQGEGSGGATALGDGTASDDAVDQAVGRRVSGFLELRDGGFGVGSAAPIEGGAQPLDHPVQAYRDTMTFWAPGDAGYDSEEPDVWFYDEGAAERSGFHRSDD